MFTKTYIVNTTPKSNATLRTYLKRKAKTPQLWRRSWPIPSSGSSRSFPSRDQASARAWLAFAIVSHRYFFSLRFLWLFRICFLHFACLFFLHSCLEVSAFPILAPDFDLESQACTQHPSHNVGKRVNFQNSTPQQFCSL